MHISIPNTVFLVNGKLVQLDDALVIAAHQKSEDNVESVTVSLSVDGNYLNISTSADIKYLARYVLALDHCDKTYDVDMGKSCTCSLSELTAKVPEGIYSASVRAESIFGKSSQPSNTENINIFVQCAPMTLRFQFSQENYDPNVLKEGRWNKGDWTHRGDNVWDWTYDNTIWNGAFNGAFKDPNNTVKIIDSGDTSSVSGYENFLESCTALTEVRKLDTRGAVTITRLFCECSSLEAIPELALESVVSMNRVFEKCGNLKQISLKNASKPVYASGLFLNCTSLETIVMEPPLQVNEMNSIFNGCTSLKTLPWMDTSNVSGYNMMSPFVGCTSLIEVPEYDTHNVNQMDHTFSGCTSLRSIPHFDTSNVTRFDFCFENTAIEKLPDWDFSNGTQFVSTFMGCQHLKSINQIDLTKATITPQMFMNCINVESGTYDLYVYLSTKPVTLNAPDVMFMNCGVDTETGREDLAKIPRRWGGTMQS